MLNRLEIENFKAWRKAELTFGKVTGFFGNNSAGKSSLLQFLLLLKQTRNATDRGLVRRRLNASGSPGVGDVFFKHVFDHQYHPGSRVRRIPVTPTSDDRRGFEELPENTFDPSDRKFLAVAVAADAVVLNATDRDWGEQQALMDGLGVKVDELCPQHV